MNEVNFINQASLGINNKYIFRKTGEEVEIVAVEQVENGVRNGEDWVSYIDSDGNEHVKEHLNLQFDFKPATSDFIKSLTNFSGLPSTKNSRLYEIVKELVVNHRYTIESAISEGLEILEAIENTGL